LDVTSLRQIGPYEVRRFIDAGAFAWVFEVEDPKFAGRRLALKMLKPEAAAGEEFRRFESEARLLARIDHPSVVTIFDFGRDEVSGNFYYVMTFVDGSTLKARLKQGPLSVEEAVPIFIDLLDGLQRLHENGIVHRDIKPANVLLGSDGRARLADLGIARVQTERSQTRTGVAVGTALYMSPEQARGREVDPRSDLFSVGLTLYEVLTGDVIYDHVDSVDSSSGMDVLMYIGSLVHSRNEFDVRFGDEHPVPAPIQKIILHTLRLDPGQRFASAAEMRDALRHAMLPPVPAPQRRGLPLRALMAVGATALILLAAVAGYFLYLQPLMRNKAARQQAERLFEEVTLSNERALALASAARDLDPAPPESLASEVDDRLERASAYLEDSTEDLRRGDFAVALTDLGRVVERQEGACQILSDQFLSARASTDSEVLRKRILALADRGAEEIAGASWAPLAAVVPHLDDPATAAVGCAAAQADVDRVQAAANGAPLADSLEAELDAVWPRLVEEAYQNGVTARLLAVAQPVEAIEYKLALKEAKLALLEGSRSLRARNYQAARNSYRTAEKGFLTASEIAPAAVARDEARQLAAAIRSEEDVDSRAASELLARGEAAWTGARWEESGGLFGEAIGQFKELRAAHEWKREAVRVRKESSEARELAVADGAERSAPTEFAQAEMSFSSAEAALERGDGKQAELGFGVSRGEYAAAQKRAIQALREGTMKQAAAVDARAQLLGEGGCAELLAPAAREHCSGADDALARGNEALSANNAVSALSQFQAAIEGLGRAGSAQALWDSSRPRPPVLGRRVPQRALVKIGPRQLLSFAVEASDPNGDVLNYSWSIDGQAQDERGPTLKRRLDASATVTVRVDDGHGGEFVESWQIEVVERTDSVEAR
jgi:hypothetical protein